MESNSEGDAERPKMPTEQEIEDLENEGKRWRRSEARHLIHLVVLLLSFAGVALSVLYVTGLGGQRFEQGCGRYLQRAVDTTDAEVAIASLDHAIHYAEVNGLTRGHSFHPPTSMNDVVGLWYGRLKRARADIAALTPTSPYLERREAFARLRAALLDPAPPGRLRIPEYAELHPYQYRSWGVLIGCSFLACLMLFRLRHPGLI